MDLLNNYKSQIPSWMRDNPRWIDLMESIVKTFQDKFLIEDNIYAFENMYDPEKINLDFVNQLYKIFAWKINNFYDITEEEIRLNLLGIFEWYRNRFFEISYYSIFYELGLKIILNVYWTKDFNSFIETPYRFLHINVITDKGLKTDSKRKIILLHSDIGGGYTNIKSPNHKLKGGEIIEIVGVNDYNGAYKNVEIINKDNFKIEKNYVLDSEKSKIYGLGIIGEIDCETGGWGLIFDTPPDDTTSIIANYIYYTEGYVENNIENEIIDDTPNGIKTNFSGFLSHVESGIKPNSITIKSTISGEEIISLDKGNGHWSKYFEDSLLTDNLIATPDMVLNLYAESENINGNFFEKKELEVLLIRINQIKPIQSEVLVKVNLESTMPKNQNIYTDTKNVVMEKTPVFQSYEAAGTYNFLSEITWKLRIGYGEISENDYDEINAFSRKYDGKLNSIIYSGEFSKEGDRYIKYYRFYDIWENELFKVDFPGIYRPSNNSTFFRFFINLP